MRHKPRDFRAPWWRIALQRAKELLLSGFCLLAMIVLPILAAAMML